ncbi:MAG TPA: hypothetical protein VFI24_26325 [Pyrinomonadaceae bacterium]|nr:hypothetical protein [Pyrinomonadaceae bacterium]
MSFDLYFCRENGSVPSTAELTEYFSALPLFKVDEIDDGGMQFCYENESTGVYCYFSYSPSDATELEGCGASGLAFNLNYNRASFFAYETMPLVEAFCMRFELMVEDVQEETREPANADRLIASWRSHNSRAMAALAAEKDDPVELLYLPEQQATEWWHYMSVRQAIEDSLTEDLFVPSLVVLGSPRGDLSTMIVHPEGIAQLFPVCDNVYITRKKKSLFRTVEESGFVTYQSIIETLNPLLDDYEFADLSIRYLRPENSVRAAALLQKLKLDSVDLGQYSQVAPDRFQDAVAQRS